eukprot:1402812-Pleurochrysis_carterae.AAC.1
MAPPTFRIQQKCVARSCSCSAAGALSWTRRDADTRASHPKSEGGVVLSRKGHGGGAWWAVKTYAAYNKSSWRGSEKGCWGRGIDAASAWMPRRRRRRRRARAREREIERVYVCACRRVRRCGVRSRRAPPPRSSSRRATCGPSR